MTVFIYVLCHPLTGEIRYVGKTILALYDRLSAHKKEHLKPRRGSTHKASWVASLARDGLSPRIEEIERIENSNDEDWQEVERFWIAYLRFIGCRLTNLESGGRGGKKASKETLQKLSLFQKGKLKSAEHRAKISAAHRGRKRSPEHNANIAKAQRGRKLNERQRQALISANLGRRMNERTREALRVSNTGRTHTPETRAKIGAANKGKPHHNSSETRAKLSAALRGRVLTPEWKAKLSVAARRPERIAALVERNKSDKQRESVRLARLSGR